MHSASKTHWKPAMFCDLDETLYDGLTIKDGGQWLLAHGYLDWRAYGQIIWSLFLRMIGRLNHERAFAHGAKLMRGWDVPKLEQTISLVYQHVFLKKISPAVRKLVKDWHKDWTVVLATESLDFIAAPIAADLEITEIIASKLKLDQGRVTGALDGPVLHDQAKNAAIIAWAKVHRLDLKDCAAIGRRPEDILMLELVGHPIVLNPVPAVRALAVERGWQIVETDDRDQ